MDTTKSQQIVQAYLQQDTPYARKIRTFLRTFDAAPGTLFPLLCPVRAMDWLPGLNPTLIYTTSGYAEEQYIFRTGPSNPYGEGLWVVTGYKPEQYIEYVRIQQDVLTLYRMTVAENKDKTTTVGWEITLTALTEQGNNSVESMPVENIHVDAIVKMLDEYVKSETLDTTRSEKLVQEYLQHTTQFKRTVVKPFSGTFETTMETLFPLFCPAREADWLPGWNSTLIYTESGYAEDKGIFITDTSNSVGEGIWTFTGFQANEYVKFLHYQEDVLLLCTITVTNNKDGTVTATWNPTFTALTEKGNKEVEKMPVAGVRYQAPVIMIEHYLKTGNTISKVSLIWKLFWRKITGK